jgi:hypothetical protein
MQKYILFEHEVPESPHLLQKYITFAEAYVIGANGMQKCMILNPYPIETPLTVIHTNSTAA